MKPRQTIKNVHHTNASPYQNQNSSTNTTIRDIDLINMMPFLQATTTQNNPTTSSGGGGVTHTGNIMGSGGPTNVDPTTNNRSTNREEIMKCLNAIYGKNSADILQNLPALNDWPMQSVSPPDYPKACNSGGGIEGSNMIVGNNIGTSCFSSTSSSNINNVINCNPGQQQKKDIHYNNNTNINNNNNQQHSSSASHQQQASSITNQFRMSASSTHSPQQHLSQQQQKSVLSLQHQHHHQNDLSNNRRLNHHLSTTNTSFTNLNSISNAAKLPLSSNLSSSDSNSLAAVSGSCLNSKNSSLTNIMDTIGQGESMFYENSTTVNKEISASMQQQPSLTRHQQLQNLLKATGSVNKLNKTTSPATFTSSSSSLSSHRNDSLSKRNSLAMSSSNMPQHPITSQQTPTISPPHAAFSSVPKSLLNLAACSSTTPNVASTSGIAPKISNMVGHLNSKSIRNSQATSSIVNNNVPNNLNLTDSNFGPKLVHHKINAVNNSNDTFNNSFKGTSSNINNEQHSNMIQLINNRTANNNINNYKVPSRYPKSSSLLLDDPSRGPNATSNSKSFGNVVNVNNMTSSVKSHIHKTNNSVPQTSKEAYIANLQERAAKAGISIGEINPPIQIPGQSNNNNNQTVYSDNNLTSSLLNQQNIADILSPTNQVRDELNPTVDRREIESAISRVEARNDLSLLYPPILLGANSQKQVNALSAGLHNSEDSELFTDEVKRIVLEECNIIYECKECNNLFRSLGNLVKHKRTFCPDYQSPERSSNADAINKPSQANNQTSTNRNINNNNIAFNNNNGDLIDEHHLSKDSQKQNNLTDFESALSAMDFSGDPSSLDLHNLRGNQLERRLRMINTVSERKNFDSDARSSNKRQGANLNRPNSSTGTSVTNISTPSTSLSKLLQSQPKNRLPVSRDSALIGALNMTTNSVMQIQSVNSNLAKALSAFESDKSKPDEMVSKQLMQNSSSLAKTLLNEKAIRQSARQMINQRQEEPSENSNFATPSGSTKRVAAPKRKFLEDCIKKVKRDKCLPGEQAGQEMEDDQRSKELNNQSESCVVANKFNSPLESDDSDMLMIDLDEPRGSNVSGRRGRRRASTAASSTASSSASSMTKHHTSSALLKALTKPVDPRKTASPIDQQTAPIDLVGNNATSIQPAAQLDDLTKNDQVEQLGKEEKLVETPILSPLFDKYACDICGEDQKDLTSLTNHTIEQHRGEKMIYPCIFCSLCYITLENVCRHIIDIHKKPKAQVYRLKEVVKSRSYLSSDFSSCSDHPQVETTMTTTSETIQGATNDVEEKSDNSLANKDDQSNAELPCDNQVPQIDTDSEIIRVDPSPHSNLEDEVVEIEVDTIQGNNGPPANENENEDEIAVEVDQDGVDGDDEEEEDDDIQVDNDDNDKQAVNEEIEDNRQPEEMGQSTPIREKPAVEEAASQEPGISSKPDENDTANSGGKKYDPWHHYNPELSCFLTTTDESSFSISTPDSSVSTPGSSFFDTTIFSSSSLYSSSSFHNTDTTTTSSSSSSSSSDGSSCSSPEPEEGESEKKKEAEPQMAGSSKSPDSKKVDSMKKTETDPQAVYFTQPELAPQAPQTPAPASTTATSNPAPEASTSSGAGGASGGIMKLKIQLKTRPDEKSKVYEIV